MVSIVQFTIKTAKVKTTTHADISVKGEQDTAARKQVFFSFDDSELDLWEIFLEKPARVETQLTLAHSLSLRVKHTTLHISIIIISIN